MKIFVKKLILSLVISTLFLNKAYAADISTNTAVSTITSGDSANFTADVELDVDASNELSAITNNTSGEGSVNFSTDNTLTVTGNIEDISAITTSTNSNGTLSLTGTSAQTIDASQIGTTDDRIGTINIDNSSGGTRNINLNSGQTFVNDINFTTSGNTTQLVIDSGSELYISGDVTPTGQNSRITGSGSTLIIDGSSAQNIDTKIGTGGARIENVNISNTSGTVTFGQDGGTEYNYIENINFTNSTGEAVLDLDYRNNISGDITATSSATITGNRIALSGTSDQTIEANLGVDSNNRLIQIRILSGKDGALIIDSDAYVDTLNTISDNSITLTVNGILNVNKLMSDDLGTNSTADSRSLTLSSGSTITVNEDISTDVSEGDTLDILGSGNIEFAGTTGQTIGESGAGITLGTTGTRLNSISISNVSDSGVTFDNGSENYTNSLNFTNSSDTATLTINSGSELTTDGDISQTSGGSSIITGDGTLTLDGTSQTIASKLGASTSDRLGTLDINSSAVTFSEDAFLTNLDISGGNTITVGAAKTIDVTNSVDFTSKTINLKVDNNGFAAVNSSGNITLDSTTINFDYQDNISELDFSGQTKYYVSNATLVGNADNITVTDDLYLFNNYFGSDDSGVYTTLTSSSELSNTGTENEGLIISAIANTDFGSDILSISDNLSLNNALESLKPMQNGAFIQENISAMSHIIDTALDRFHNINFTNNEGLDKEYERNNGLWMKAFGGANSKKDEDSVKGYESFLGGVALGYDRKIKSFESNHIIGFGAGYSHSGIRGNSSLTQNNDSIDSYHVAIYNSNSGKDGLGLYNENALVASYNQYKTNRQISIGNTSKEADANFDGISYMAQTGFGYRLRATKSLLFTPKVSAKYIKITQDDYQEIGAGDSGLKVVNEDFDNVLARAGFDITHKINFNSFKFITKFDFYREDKLMDAYQEQSIRFIGGGDAFQNNSLDIQDELYGAGVSFKIFSNKGHQFNLKYDAQLADKFTSHTGSAQYKFEF